MTHGGARRAPLLECGHARAQQQLSLHMPLQPRMSPFLLHQTAHRVRNLLEGGASRREAVCLELVLGTLA